MVMSFKALTLTVVACTEEAAAVRPSARNTGIRRRDLAGKEKDRSVVLMIFNSKGISQMHYLANGVYLIGFYRVKYRRDAANYKECGTVRS
jgi:hypothetical protein